MQHETNAIRNEQQIDRVDIKKRNGGVLRMAQCNDGDDGGDDEVGATRNFSMMRCVRLQ